MSIIGVIVGVVVIAVISGVISIAVSSKEKEKKNDIPIVFSKKLENSDYSIRDAIEFMAADNSLVKYAKR